MSIVLRLLSLAGGVPVWAWALAALLAWGGWHRMQHRSLVAAQATEAADRQAAARELERLAARNNQRIADELTRARLSGARAAADAAGRLRDLAASAARPGTAAAACRNDDAGPAAGVLRDDVREDLVALAADADAVADRLRACQQREALTPGHDGSARR